MDLQVKRANLALFRKLIAGEPDDERRRMLEDALDAEEARFEASLREDQDEPEPKMASARR